MTTEDQNFPDPEILKKQLIERANKKYSEFSKNKDEKISQKPTGIFQKAKTYFEAIASRGLSDKTCSEETKTLRLLSCHGDDNSLLPCSERRQSKKYDGSFYCGACGCGDKKGTQLVNLTIENKLEYSKLDYPKVSCPLKMPGFTDYVETEENVSENSRKKEIETRYGIEYIKKHSNP
jgi:hypothetical protein